MIFQFWMEVPELPGRFLRVVTLADQLNRIELELLAKRPLDY